MKLVYPNYKHSILNVTNSLFKHYNVPHTYASLPLLDNVLADQPDHVILVLLDGLGTNVINKHLAPEDIIRKQMKTELTSVFPPTTVAATNSVLSGVPPIVNGHLAWVQYFTQENAHAIIFLNKDFYTDKPFKVDLRTKYLSYTTMQTQIQAHNPELHVKEFFPPFMEGGSKTFAEQIDRVLLSTHNCDQSFNYVYWVEPDLVEHQYGITSVETKQTIQHLNEQVQILADNIPDNTTILLIADHGLIDITTIPLHDYPDIIELMRLQPSFEPRTTTFFIKEGKENEFEQRFNNHFSNQFKLYRTPDFLATKLLGEGPMNPAIEQCFGEFVSVATSDAMFGLNEAKGYKAHHAGLTEGEMIVPLMIYQKK